MIAAHPDDERTARAGLLRARPAHAHRLSFAHPRRRRPEPDRRRAGRAARASSARRNCWPRARSTAPSSSSPAPSISASPRPPPRRLKNGGTTASFRDVVWVIRRYRPDVIHPGLQRHAARWPRPAPGLRPCSARRLRGRRRSRSASPSSCATSSLGTPSGWCRPRASAASSARRWTWRTRRPAALRPRPPRCRRDGYRRFQPHPRATPTKNWRF